LCFLLLVCLGCSAQSLPPDTVKTIERQVRGYYHLPPDVQVTVGPASPSEFPNYDKIKITIAQGEKHDDYDFLLSKDAKTLARMTKMDLTKDPYAEVMKKIDTAGRPTRGNKSAKVVVVNFDDFQCPFCSRMHQTLFPQMLQEYGDRVLFVYKDFPLTDIHHWATRAAVDANCLAAQNNDAYWQFADYIHANQSVVNNEKAPDAQFALIDKAVLAQGQKSNLDMTQLQSCIKAQKEDAVKASMREGDGLGITATPTLYINGYKTDGALPPDQLRKLFDQALKDAGVAAPDHSAPAAGGPAAKPTGN
jgi:protein-disulfide isomerase